ncbi:phage major capsid protein [Streptomyces rhizosphaericus]|uniref:Phage major capsid protein n=1 Tax=Streptomyces rhizosphaericus TaxID=114699 RepID=A0A6G4ASB3_9ACTN|nr:phage major capsid protein [Streptomyces rhizosphaericus]NEW76245.1 phage major capsid protein [Streptomyces rhizosphaericus]
MPSELVRRVKENRTAAWNEAKRIADRAAEEDRAFTAEEDSRTRKLFADIELFDERIAQLEDDKRRADETSAILSGYGNARGYRINNELADSFRSMILERNPRPIDVRWENARSAYQPGLERRNLVTTSPANMAPVSFYGRLVEHMVENSAVLRAGATLLTTTSGETLRVPRTSALSTASIVSEGGTIPASDPTLSSVPLGAFKYAFLVQVSSELVQDSGVDLEGYLAREAGQAIGLGLGAHLVNGTGSGQPRGVILDATTGATGPTGTATSFGSQGTAGQGTDLIYDLFGSLAEPYVLQPASGWLLRNATLTAIRKLKATTGEVAGTEFVTDGPAGASGAMIGKPVFIDPFVPAMGASAKSVLFGDWSRYFVRMVNGIRFERSDDYAFNSDLVTFRAILRADAALVDTTGAIKWFAHSAS